MREQRGLTAEELAERWNVRVRKGVRKGELNLDYVREKARIGLWKTIRLPGSRFVLFDRIWVEAVERAVSVLEPVGSKPRSLKIERKLKAVSSSQRKERRW